MKNEGRIMKKTIATLAVAMLCCGLAGPAAAATYSFTFTGTPLTIDDYKWVYADMDVGGDLGTITDVNVFVNIEHTWVSDLEIYIGHSEDGGATWKNVQLYNHDGDYRNDITEVLFNDQAATSITDAAPPYGPGSYQPTSYPGEISPGVYESNLLADYNGDLAAGIWSLAVYDYSSGDIGTLKNFRVDLVTTPVPLPGAVVLLGSSLVALVGVRRRSGRK
jgi:subtilisin-like proprotein convertase family protein